MGVGIKYVGIKYGRLEVVETSEIGNIRCISVVTVGEEEKPYCELGKLHYRDRYTSLLVLMVVSIHEHLEKLARGGGLVNTVKGHSLLERFDKTGKSIDGTSYVQSDRDGASINEMNVQFPLPRLHVALTDRSPF